MNKMMLRPAWMCVFLFTALSAHGRATAPSTEALLRLLIRNEGVQLDVNSPEKACNIETDAGPIHTLGDYLAHLGSALASNNGQNKVASACASKKEGQRCELWFSTGGGTDSPWRY